MQFNFDFSDSVFNCTFNWAEIQSHAFYLSSKSVLLCQALIVNVRKLNETRAQNECKKLNFIKNQLNKAERLSGH